jgi:hypothetical protein
MKTEHKQLESLLEKHGLRNRSLPVTSSHEHRSKKRVYARLLKTLGLYSAIQAPFLFIYFSLKKTGIATGIVKAVIIASIIGGISFSIYYALHTKEVRVQKNEQTPVTENSILPKKDTADTVPVVSVDTVIKPFTGKGDTQTLASSLSAALNSSLKKIKGNQTVLLSDSAPETAAFMVTGSVEQLDASKVLFVKITNIRSGAIIYMSKTPLTDNANEAVLSKIAQEIAVKTGVAR